MVHKMKTLEEVLYDYTRGEKTLEEANKALKELGCGSPWTPPAIFLRPGAAGDPGGRDAGRGQRLGHSGPRCGQPEKVHVVNGRTVDVDMGQGTAYVYMAGKRYRLRGDVLTEED